MNRSSELAETVQMLFDQGLTIVPYTTPSKYNDRAGKIPMVWQPEHPVSRDLVGRRADCTNLEQLNLFRHRTPNLNIAILPVIQVDADSPVASITARELGVSSGAAVWIIRTRRGHRAIYRPDPDRPDLRNAVKARGVDLDLLINSPALVPPSVHPSGFHYRWIEGHSPFDVRFNELDTPPAVLLDWWENTSKPRREIPSSGTPIHGIGFIATLRGIVEAKQARGLASPNSDGWQSGNCVFPENHRNGDRSASFSINFELAGWTCFGGCGSGTLADLAERLGIPAPVVRGRGRHVHSVRITEGSV